MPFAIRSKNVFLTFPQCPAPKEHLLRHMQTLLRPVHYVVAHELHADGSDHLHAYFELPTVLRTSSAKYFDFYHDNVLYHGNYQGCRSVNAVKAYVAKGDDFLTDLPLSKLRPKPSIKKLVAQQLLAGQTLENVLEEFPEIVFDYGRLRTNLALLALDRQKWEPLPGFLPNPWGLLLPSDRPEKRRHYWIWSSEPNAGKTTKFAMPLRLSAVLQTQYLWWNVTPGCPAVILDDYNGGVGSILSFQALNQLCDNTFQFRLFMGGAKALTNRYIVIVLSNKHIRDIYPNAYPLLEARFIDIEVKPL